VIRATFALAHKSGAEVRFNGEWKFASLADAIAAIPALVDEQLEVAAPHIEDGGADFVVRVARRSFEPFGPEVAWWTAPK